MVASCAVVGIRLLVLGARTRRLPEFLFGSSFVLLGAIGYPLSILARGGGPGGTPSTTLLLVALAAQNLASLCMYVTTWRTFHPDRRWIAGPIAIAALLFGASLLVGGSTGDPDHGPGYYLGFLLRAGAFVWASYESQLYYGAMKRRLAIGLGDPVVTDRFRLWNLATMGIVMGFGIFLAGRLTGANVGTVPWVLVATSLVSLLSGVTMWLAFFPPRAYLRRVLDRAPS
jgi:hypothetical protein